MKALGLMEITSQSEIANGIYELKMRGELAARMRNPGQFLHIKVNSGSDPLLRRPISICDVDEESNEVTMIYRVEGAGTKALADKTPGMMLDVLGPLGHGFPVNEALPMESALLVGGGIGVPPLYYLAKQLIDRGVSVTTVLGFQTKDAIFYSEQFSELGPLSIATVDGSSGYKGFVTDIIEEKKLTFDVLYACGPTPMLKALQGRYTERRAFLSLEQRMGCGVGACFACVCHTQDDPDGVTYKKVCTDGPVFRAGEVVL